MLVNTGLLRKAVNSSGYKQYQLAEFEDVLQNATLYYMEIIQRCIDSGEKDYPETIYPELLRTIQENLSRPYANGGMAMPYSTRKMLNRQNYEKTSKIGATSSYSNDLDSAKKSHLEAQMAFSTEGMSFEDKLCIKIVVQEILSKISPETKNMFIDRYLNDLTYSELGGKYACSDDHARYEIGKIKQLRRGSILGVLFY